MINLNELRKFLVKAKISTYAGGGKEVEPQRPGFKELEYKEGNYEYRDSYCGFYSAPGQEIVRFNGKPIWHMAYSGGMKKGFHYNLEFAKQTFKFLKECLKRVSEEKPYRGPDNFKEKDYEYVNNVEGNIEEFRGLEKILFKGKVVFEQNYMGGVIIEE